MQCIWWGMIRVCSIGAVMYMGAAWCGEGHKESISAMQSFLQWDHLTDDWGGHRSRLEEKGLTFEFVNTLDLARNYRGGLRSGNAALGNFDMTLTVDTEKAGLWDNGTFFIYGLANYSSRLLSEELVGDLQVVSNIEAPEELRLNQLWYEHSFFNGKLAVLAGQHDLNSEFVATEYGGLFPNSSFGIQPDCAGASPVSIFPQPALALRFLWKPVDWFESRTAVYDGSPGDPAVDNKHGLRWKFSSTEGAMLIQELAFHFWQGEDAAFLPGTIKLGGWFHTGRFEDVLSVDSDENPLRHDKNYGLYFIADQALYREDRKKDDQGLSMFFQIGGAPKDRNEVDSYIGGGIHYKGLIPKRDEDEFGMAVAHAHISKDLRKAESRNYAETALEVTYRAQITPWLAVQPDFQYVINPGANPELKNALVDNLRITIDF